MALSGAANRRPISHFSAVDTDGDLWPHCLLPSPCNIDRDHSPDGHKRAEGGNAGRAMG